MKKDPNQEALDFYDLLVDESDDEFSEYVSISISNENGHTKVKVATADDDPTVYSATLDGVSASDLKSILQNSNARH